MDHQSAGESRKPPRERFAPCEDEIHLPDAIAVLRAEPGAGQHGHRQMALFHHGQATVALYSFQAGAKLPGHVVDGPVIIHVLTGRLKVSTAADAHELPAGALLRLAPGVAHDVVAGEASDMLLTVCYEGE